MDPAYKFFAIAPYPCKNYSRKVFELIFSIKNIYKLRRDLYVLVGKPEDEEITEIAETRKNEFISAQLQVLGIYSKGWDTIIGHGRNVVAHPGNYLRHGMFETLVTDFNIFMISIIKYNNDAKNFDGNRRAACLRVIVRLQKIKIGLEGLKVMVELEKEALPIKEIVEIKNYLTPSGRKTKYKYNYKSICKEGIIITDINSSAIILGDLVRFNDYDYKVICGNGGDNFEDPLVIIGRGTQQATVFASQLALVTQKL